MSKIGDTKPTRTHMSHHRTPATYSEGGAVASPPARYTRDGFDAPALKGSSGVAVPAGQPRPNLTSQGGSRLTAPVVTPIYVGSYWTSAAGQADRAYNDGFAKDFGSSSISSVLSQYGAGAGSFGGSTVSSTPVAKRVTDRQVQAIVARELAAGHVKPSAQGLYTVVLPPGTTLVSADGTSSRQGVGGYHSSFQGTDGKPVYYAAIAYSDAKGNGINFDGSSRDAVTITESHEWAEAATDPDVNSYDPKRRLGLYDAGINAEIGDLAIEQLDLSKTYTRVDGYAQQLEWSNHDGQYEVAAQKG